MYGLSQYDFGYFQMFLSNIIALNTNYFKIFFDFPVEDKKKKKETKRQKNLYI